jgi:hypothetical protein
VQHRFLYTHERGIALADENGGDGGHQLLHESQVC